MRYVDSGSDVFGRRADGHTYERVYELSPACIDRSCIFENSAYKSLYTVRIKRRTFLPNHFCRSMHGIWHCNAALRKCRESYGVCDSNCYGSIARWNDEKLAVTMLLFLCYPVKWFVWIFVAAAVGSKGVSIIEGKKE